MKGYSTVPTELWTDENLLKSSRYEPPDFSTMAGETICSFWELKTTHTFSWQSSWWWILLMISFPATQWIICRWISRDEGIVGWRSDYEGHQSKEATKKFKIFFIGIVYKATWKAMKKKAFIWLLCLPTFLHLRMRPKSIDFALHWVCNEKKNQIFYMLWQYKLDKNFDLTFGESRSLLSSMLPINASKCWWNFQSNISRQQRFQGIFGSRLQGAGLAGNGRQSDTVGQKKQWRTMLRT